MKKWLLALASCIIALAGIRVYLENIFHETVVTAAKDGTLRTYLTNRLDPRNTGLKVLIHQPVTNGFQVYSRSVAIRWPGKNEVLLREVFAEMDLFPYIFNNEIAIQGRLAIHHPEHQLQLTMKIGLIQFLTSGGKAILTGVRFRLPEVLLPKVTGILRAWPYVQPFQDLSGKVGAYGSLTLHDDKASGTIKIHAIDLRIASTEGWQPFSAKPLDIQLEDDAIRLKTPVTFFDNTDQPIIQLKKPEPHCPWPSPCISKATPL